MWMWPKTLSLLTLPFSYFHFIFYDTPVGACVQQSDTSRRSMVTFTRSQILSPSFRVTLSAAACSLFLFRSSGVRGSQRDGLLSWFLFRHTLACWDATHCLWQWNSCNSLLLTPESISNPPLRCFLVVLVQIANWLKSILKRQKKTSLTLISLAEYMKSNKSVWKLAKWKTKEKVTGLHKIFTANEQHLKVVSLRNRKDPMPSYTRTGPKISSNMFYVEKNFKIDAPYISTGKKLIGNSFIFHYEGDCKDTANAVKASSTAVFHCR